MEEDTLMIRLHNIMAGKNFLLQISIIFAIVILILGIILISIFYILMSKIVMEDTGMTILEMFKAILQFLVEESGLTISELLNEVEGGKEVLRIIQTYVVFAVVFCLSFLFGFIINILAWLKNDKKLSLISGIAYFFSSWINAVLCIVAYSQLKRE